MNEIRITLESKGPKIWAKKKKSTKILLIWKPILISHNFVREWKLFGFIFVNTKRQIKIFPTTWNCWINYFMRMSICFNFSAKAENFKVEYLKGHPQNIFISTKNKKRKTFSSQNYNLSLFFIWKCFNKINKFKLTFGNNWSMSVPVDCGRRNIYAWIRLKWKVWRPWFWDGIELGFSKPDFPATYFKNSFCHWNVAKQKPFSNKKFHRN